MTEEYQGWSNRETWACNLWLTNEEGIYNEMMELTKRYPDKYELAVAIKDYVEELADIRAESPGLLMMFDDIGSLWRVDWVEIAEGFCEG